MLPFYFPLLKAQKYNIATGVNNSHPLCVDWMLQEPMDAGSCMLPNAVYTPPPT